MNIKDKDIDALIDGFMKNSPVEPRAGFADFAVKAALAADSQSAPLDEQIDKMLSRIFDFRPSGFTDRTVDAAIFAGRRLRERIASCAAAFAVAACSLAAVFSGIADASLTRGIPSKADYAEMNKISDEISQLKVIVAQEEFFDIMKM